MSASRTLALAVAIALLSLLHGLPARAQGTTADQAFRDGIAAFHGHRYRSALSDFLRAEQAGMHSAALYYNLGVTYYHLGRYPQARDAFLKSAGSPGMAALSYYNLGLVAYREGRHGAARYWFDRARKTAETKTLRQLAERMLGRLPGTRRWYGLARLSAGYDDNAILASDNQVISASRKGAAYGGLLLAGQGLVHGDWQSGVRVLGALDTRRYAGLSGYDLGSYALSVEGTRPLGNWQTRARAGVGRVDFGGRELERTAGLTLRGARPVTDGLRLALRYRFVRILGGSGYGYLDGWRQELRGSFGAPAGASGWQLWYTFELNRRRDLRQGPVFLSFSPVRQTLGVRYSHPVAAGIVASARLSWQYSVYRDPDTRVVAGSLVTKNRTDRRPMLQFGLHRDFAGKWRTALQLGYEEDNSNFASDSYHRGWAEVSLERFF
ncbi:MAG TPA: tetratricopeptide repeat protein [Gammaproteobacteria bacterium]|nr:tetratricopeptide repeat protein [Gammaproteobacteria bacterium]